MNERNCIEFFRGSCAKPEGNIETFLCPIDANHSFIGKELVIEDDFSIIYYFIPFSNNDAILLTCVEEDGKLTESFDGYSQRDLEILRPSFPNTIRAIFDGNNANLTNFAIVRLDSNGHEFDCVATKVSNVDILDLETDYILMKAVELCSFASDVIGELDWDRVTFGQKARIVGNAMLRGAQTAIKVYKIDNLLNRIL